MAFWTRLFNTAPNPATEDYNPGDPGGVQLIGAPTYSRSLPFPMPSPWSGWPSEWSTPIWQGGPFAVNRLIDSAWGCIDLNSSVLASMPVYRMANGQIAPPLQWMIQPDPLIYSSWNEFIKQVFFDYHLGEVFILPMATYADGYPRQMRVIPPWLVSIEMENGSRSYFFAGEDVTDSILHIRYHTNTINPHGMGPLDFAGARVVTAGLLNRYATRLAETGGVPLMWMEIMKRLTQTEANELIEQWVQSRSEHAAHPAIVSGGAKLNQAHAMSAKDMALLEMQEFTDGRIAVLLGVPPFLMGLATGMGRAGSLTYSNVSQLFDFHDRASLRPKADAVMSALSLWALPAGQTVELNRDEYSRPSLLERSQAYQILYSIGALTAQEIRDMERLKGDISALQLSGATEHYTPVAPNPETLPPISVAPAQPSRITPTQPTPRD